MSTAKIDRPDFMHPAAKAVLPDLLLVDRLLGGTRTMHEHSAEYVRKWADEDPKIYDIRRNGEELYGAYERTLSASVGMLFAKPPTLDWNSLPAAEDHWQNLDGAGNAGPVLLKRFAEKAVNHGLAVILVDHTPRPRDEDGNLRPVDSDMEQALGLRPVWGYYPRSAIRSWRIQVVRGTPVLTQIVLQENGFEMAGSYGVRPYERYRVLRLGEAGAMWQLVEKDQEGGEFVPLGSGVFRNAREEAADFLPVAIAHTGRSDGLMESSLPLLPLAFANLHHWLRATNLRFLADLTCFPQAVITGEIQSQGVDSAGAIVPGRLKLGPAAYVHLKGDGASFGWEAPPSESWQHHENDLQARERRMAQLGMSFLAPDTRAAETAEAKRLDATAQNATLATAAAGIDDAVNRAMEIHAWYQGVEASDAPTFALNRDFENTAMDSQTMLAYVQAVQDAGLPPRILLQAWQQGGRIHPDVDLEALELEMLAGIRAADDQEAEERRMAAEAILGEAA